jgi:type I restriction-modification system DNA methylase subunit
LNPGQAPRRAAVRGKDKAQNEFANPAKLRRVIVDLIDAENCSAMGADVKGDAYEGLLERNAQDRQPLRFAATAERIARR